jgi:hypothetical protein
VSAAVAAGATISVTPVTQGYPGNGFVWQGNVSATDTVQVQVYCIAAGTPSATAYNVNILNGIPNIGGTWAQVNAKTGTGATNPVMTAAFTNPLTPGSLIIVAVAEEYTAISTPTDTATNTYVDAGPGAVLFNGSARAVEVFYAINSHSTASNVISVANSGLVSVSISASEWTGNAPSSPVDTYSLTTNGTTGSGSNNLTSGFGTTAFNGDLIFGFASGVSSGISAVGTGFALINSPTGYQMAEDLIQAALGSVAATWTDSNGAGAAYGAIMVAFKP